MAEEDGRVTERTCGAWEAGGLGQQVSWRRHVWEKKRPVEKEKKSNFKVVME
jgi:hypothetical protein